MLIDTHAHLADPKLESNLAEIIKDAENSGVQKIISVGCSVSEAKKSIKISMRYPNVYATAGLYPFDPIKEQNIPISKRLDDIYNMSAHPKVKAIGECGLDFSTPAPWEAPRDTFSQEELFRLQIEIARKRNLPVSIHSRRASASTIRILKDEIKKSPFKAVWHCFSEKWETAEPALKIGLMFSFTGIITYHNAKGVLETVRKVPLKNIMLETDSPLLVPQTAKDKEIKINEPKYARITAQKIAQIKEISELEVEKITSKNAMEFFGL
ncbi:hypothetical protein A2982_03340 [candidate division WWE3 bacterium RIFCSPLOWO2_01_FULL_39_13]|uniref:Hydrolase TatD n=1 Tax=candidate division WWE3 bacterium RIFCSPLOWO2_01_FULL_39_13 TaxID=1802624 RepID=A0A1F4V3P2_UNCKA|nr:MAG: hypothetical protein A2982_03340 [candidate division WWE3 bacterium RIFCSPLOWO2_01_FULL_39_13]